MNPSWFVFFLCFSSAGFLFFRSFGGGGCFVVWVCFLFPESKSTTLGLPLPGENIVLFLLAWAGVRCSFEEKVLVC